MGVTRRCLLVLAMSATVASAQTPQEAESIYKERCASCHEMGVARAPNRDGLRRLTPEAIAAALATGSMRQQGQELTLAQIQLLARTRNGAWYYAICRCGARGWVHASLLKIDPKVARKVPLA